MLAGKGYTGSKPLGVILFIGMELHIVKLQSNIIVTKMHNLSMRIHGDMYLNLSS